MKKPNGVGVVVGRFQVHWLHEGHLQILHQAAQHKKMIIFLACHPFLVTRENPLDYPTREIMIRSRYNQAMTFPIMDRPTDEEWSKVLDKAIRDQCPLDSVTLYSGEDGFHSHYKGEFDVEVIDNIKPGRGLSSGSEIRADVGQEVLPSENFRRGVIYASRNQYRRINPAVDIAIVSKSWTGQRSAGWKGNPGVLRRSGSWSVLLGRKPGETRYRFPGGFADPAADESYEATARRELYEETRLTAEGAMNYLGSFRIDDWRASRSNAVFSNFYWTQFSHGAPIANDDLDNVRWVVFDALEEHIAPGHLPLVIALKEALHYEPSEGK